MRICQIYDYLKKTTTNNNIMQYKQTNWQNKISHLFRAHNGNITKKKVFIRTLMSFSFNMWVKFVVGSLLRSERFFSGYSGFPLFLKNQHFQIPIQPGIR